MMFLKAYRAVVDIINVNNCDIDARGICIRLNCNAGIDGDKINGALLSRPLLTTQFPPQSPYR